LRWLLPFPYSDYKEGIEREREKERELKVKEKECRRNRRNIRKLFFSSLINNLPYLI
jgi:hypothetical protein